MKIETVTYAIALVVGGCSKKVVKALLKLDTDDMRLIDKIIVEIGITSLAAMCGNYVMNEAKDFIGAIRNAKAKIPEKKQKVETEEKSKDE